MQTPTIYFGSPPLSESSADHGDEEFRKASERWCFADRAISTPEYFDNQDGYDHKWDDVTLYEPHPVRAWRGWHFELSSRFPRWSGDIANSVKITLSERSRTLLEEAPDSIPCTWPDLESTDLFFSFSQMGHDKIIEFEPPYRGVWLHRSGDWIVETVTTADEDVLSLGPGLAYVLGDSQLTPQVSQALVRAETSSLIFGGCGRCCVCRTSYPAERSRSCRIRRSSPVGTWPSDHTQAPPTTRALNAARLIAGVDRSDAISGDRADPLGWEAAHPRRNACPRYRPSGVRQQPRDLD